MGHFLGQVRTEVVLAGCGPATLDERAAAAEALAAFLFELRFAKWNGTPRVPLPSEVSTFQLRTVQREWPEPDDKLAYPCASIIDLGAGLYEGANFTPTILEETIDRHGPGTVLWKIDEFAADFQVDFFTDDKPTREAIAAALPGAFSPGESTGVILQCSERYYGATCRATLKGKSRPDDGNTAYVRERRLQTTIRVEIPVLDLRASVGASFVATVTSIGPASDVPCSDEGATETSQETPSP